MVPNRFTVWTSWAITIAALLWATFQTVDVLQAPPSEHLYWVLGRTWGAPGVCLIASTVVTWFYVSGEG